MSNWPMFFFSPYECQQKRFSALREFSLSATARGTALWSTHTEASGGLVLRRLTTSVRVTAIWISLTSYLLGHVQRAASQGKGNLFKSFSRDLIALIPASRASLITFPTSAMARIQAFASALFLHFTVSFSFPYLSAALEPDAKLRLTTSPRNLGPRRRPLIPSLYERLPLRGLWPDRCSSPLRSRNRSISRRV